jgi:hypothetical protein
VKLVAAAAALALLGAAAPSGAKTVCGQFGDPDGRFFVLAKVKTKVGSLGPVVGYLITPAGIGTPFSGHYSVVSDDRIFVSASDGAGQEGVSSVTNLRNWSAPFAADTGNGTQYGARVDGQGQTVTPIQATSVSFEDCKNVPKFGVSN